MLSSDFWLQPDTRNSYGISASVFENVSAPNEPSALCFENSRSLADTHCEPVILNTGRLVVFCTTRLPEYSQKQRKLCFFDHQMIFISAEQQRNQGSEMHLEVEMVESVGRS